MLRGGGRLLPLGVMRCAWLGEASKATFFFLLSDSDLIEPFVSGQFDVYIESLRSITVGQGCRFWTNILINPRQPQYFIHTHTHPGHFGGVSIVFISFISYISFFFKSQVGSLCTLFYR